MMVSNSGSIITLLRWQQSNVSLFAMASGAVVLLHQIQLFFELPFELSMPGLPVAVVGGALGIFVSFRTNSAYDRWWEGRKLWGRLINTSRHISTQIVSWVEDEALRKELVERHITYVHTLRILLRKQDLAEDAEMKRYNDADTLDALKGQTNPTHALLQEQQGTFTALANEGKITEYRLQQLDNSILHLLDIQGGCERIKKTPIPRGYGFIAEQLIRYYAILLPIAIVQDLVWLSIPITVLVCLAFALISEAGRVLEDPFTLFYNGLPLFAMSMTIEQNLRNRLGETDMEPLPGPVDGILM
jgi:putative membrane protein